MNIKIFKTKLAVYGSDLSRWPGDIHDDALMLIDKSDEAAELYHESQGLDALLDSFTVPPAPAFDINKLTFEQQSSTSVFVALKEQLSSLLTKPAVPAGLAALATFILLMILQPFGSESVTTNRIDLPLTVAIEPFLAEWEQMATMSQQDIRQAEEIFGLLPVTDMPDSEIQAFLEEIETNYTDQLTAPSFPDDLWQSFTAANQDR